MSFYTLYNIKQDVAANLPGGGIDQLTDFFATFDKGRRAMLGEVRPEELIRTSYLEEAHFPDVDRYAVPAELKYDDIIELKRLAGYRNVDTIEKPLELVYRRRFGQKRGGAANVMNIGYENGIKYARVFRPSRTPAASLSEQDANETQYVLIHNCDSLSENGTWNVSGNVVNLREDKLHHVIGRGSLQFDINNSSTTGSLINFTLTPFDLYDFLQRGAIFNWLNLPIPKELISVTIKVGSDSLNLATDYYYTSVNQPHDNNQFITGWNLLKYMMRDLSMVGTPNPRALTWVEIEFNTTGNPIPECNLDNIVARQGTVYEITYNSTYIVQDANTNAWKKKPTSNSDVIIAEEDTYDILVAEITLAAQREAFMALPGAQSAIESIGIDLKNKYRKYKLEHKSEAVLETESYHVFGNMYDGYSDDPMPGYGDNYGDWGGGLNN